MFTEPKPPALYLVLLTHILYPQGVHRPDHGLHGSEYVLVNQLREPLSIFITVSRPMDDSHLLDKGTFPTFTSSYKTKQVKNTIS